MVTRTLLLMLLPDLRKRIRDRIWTRINLLIKHLNSLTVRGTDAYLAHHRHEMVDKKCANRISRANRGRLTAASIGMMVLHVMRRCHIGECTHDRHLPTCEWHQPVEPPRLPLVERLCLTRWDKDRSHITSHCQSQEVVYACANVSAEVPDLFTTMNEPNARRPPSYGCGLRTSSTRM